MIDSKELVDLIAEVRDCNERDLRLPVSRILSALDTLARILAASPDVREIEQQNVRPAFSLTPGELMDAYSAVCRHRATLLDVVRRKDAEIQELRDEIEQWEHVEKTSVADNIAMTAERDAARTVLQEERERHAGTRARLEQLRQEAMTGGNRERVA